MLIAVLSGFITALLLIFFGRVFKGRASILLTVLPLSLFVYFLGLVPSLAAGEPVYTSYKWIPSLGVHFDFYLDGLSSIFCLLITGIGSLVFAYAAAYLKGHPHLDRFFGYLCIFMASMLGLVLSDNVLSLFVFWELTSISSFFLIGFDNNDRESRRSSLTALAITGGGGFLLLAGFILAAGISESYSIRHMLQSSELLKEHMLYPLVLVLLLAGAFTKSAQFPFHFWLPGAMKAPTPVSAYLHSATMVKAGIYLLARFTPVLGDHPFWNITLLVTGGVTMLYAAFHAIIRTDLKRILAYSTIGVLGLLVFLLGVGTSEAFLAFAVFILVHALYKGALFLVAGAIDHETGTRDVTRLNGLRKHMPFLALAGLLAAISNAGIPLSFGFLGKDLMYEATLGTGSAIVFTAALVLLNVLLTYAGFVTGIKPFTGNLPHALRHVHSPPTLLWLPALLLGICGLTFGIFPALIDASIIQPAAHSISGSDPGSPLKIWHGWNLVLALSLVTVALAILFYLFRKPSKKQEQNVARFAFLSPQQLLREGGKKVEVLANRYTDTIQKEPIRVYVLIILSFVTGVLAYKLFSGLTIYIDRSQFSELTVYEVVVTGIMLASIGFTLTTSSRLTAVATMGVVGYCICLLFVFYSAPDLAMTQFTIDTLTVVLFVLVLFKLPPFLNFTNRSVKIRDALLSFAFGALISIIALEVLNEPVNKDISRYYGDHAYTLAKGKNIVNVILVDFRGMDTLVEITVLTIAAIGVYSLLKLKINQKGENQL